jgi:hypothetical protein
MFKTKLIILKVYDGQYKLCVNYVENPRVFKSFFWLYHDAVKKNIFMCCDFVKTTYILRNVLAWSALELQNLLQKSFFELKLVNQNVSKKANFYNLGIKTKKLISRRQKFLIIQSRKLKDLVFENLQSKYNSPLKKFNFCNFIKKKPKKRKVNFNKQHEMNNDIKNRKYFFTK